MKTLISLLASLFLLSLSAAQATVKWVDLPTAEVLGKKYPQKRILVMFYTTWCGYCRLMDGTTLEDPAVVKYIRENFIPVRIDAETQKVITYRRKKYPYLRSFRVNGLAYSLLNGRLGFPSFVVLDKDGNNTDPLRGYLPTSAFLKFLRSGGS